mmetsp:Transcript_20137/g.41737  ORF Transcript_20137/g.41737 Transcript_20137/m.41737 type:complete len:210 (+) Transcript_20137:981-1610(+)
MADASCGFDLIHLRCIDRAGVSLFYDGSAGRETGEEGRRYFRERLLRAGNRNSRRFDDRAGARSRDPELQLQYFRWDERERRVCRIRSRGRFRRRATRPGGDGTLGIRAKPRVRDAQTQRRSFWCCSTTSCLGWLVCSLVQFHHQAQLVLAGFRSESGVDRSSLMGIFKRYWYALNSCRKFITYSSTLTQVRLLTQANDCIASAVVQSH